MFNCSHFTKWIIFKEVQRRRVPEGRRHIQLAELNHAEGLGIWSHNRICRPPPIPRATVRVSEAVAARCIAQAAAYSESHDGTDLPPDQIPRITVDQLEMMFYGHTLG